MLDRMSIQYPSIFLKSKYDEKIDFVKGLCILFVILNHCIDDLQGILFPLWGSPAVSIFLLIQVFHVYKKERIEEVHWKSIFFKSIFKRVLKPFLFVQFLLFFIWLTCYNEPFVQLLKLFLYNGGKGPGSYYIWIYIQFCLCLPLLAPILNKMSHLCRLVFFIAVSQLLEIFMCVVNVPPYIYQLLSFRYLFLIYLGYELCVQPFVLSVKTVLLSVLSLLALIFFSYSNLSVSPLFYNHPHHTICHWPCYYYVSVLLLFLYVNMYQYFARHARRIKNLFCFLGKESFNVFLAQMFLFSVLDIFPMRPWIVSITNEQLGGLLYVAICVIMSISPVCLLLFYKSKS